MIKDHIAELIENAAKNTNYLIYEFSIYLKGENSKISVKIDTISGVSHNDCDIYSKELSRLLDEAEILPNYSLEISSPGVNRKIGNIEEFQRFLKAPAKVVYEIDGKREVFQGIIAGVHGKEINLKFENKELSLTIDSIIKANLDY